MPHLFGSHRPGLYPLQYVYRGRDQKHATHLTANQDKISEEKKIQMTTIPLTRGMTAMIDDQDADRVLAHDWRAGMNDRGDLFPISSKQKPTIRLSRFILDLPQGMEIRHANGNRFDCRRENLVVVTRGQGQHLKPRMKPSSGFRGVCHRRQGWGARITRDKRIMFLGYHRTAEDAARRYDVEALQLYDDSARLNFPAV